MSGKGGREYGCSGAVEFAQHRVHVGGRVVEVEARTDEVVDAADDARQVRPERAGGGELLVMDLSDPAPARRRLAYRAPGL
jgi:hypothetical protein